MRYDDSKSEEFTSSKLWDDAESRFLLYQRNQSPDAENGYVVNSFSGNERNRLFFQSEGNFDEASTVSGADFRQDGRGFVLFDFDQDGWLDMGVNSAQRPRFRILRNSMGDHLHNYRSVFIRLIGGHRGVKPAKGMSPRDPIGATMEVNVGGTVRAYQLSAGEGLSSQNSLWIHVGMGEAKQIDQIQIKWPGGKQTTHGPIQTGQRVRIFEDGQASEFTPSSRVENR